MIHFLSCIQDEKRKNFPGKPVRQKNFPFSPGCGRMNSRQYERCRKENRDERVQTGIPEQRLQRLPGKGPGEGGGEDQRDDGSGLGTAADCYTRRRRQRADRSLLPGAETVKLKVRPASAVNLSSKSRQGKKAIKRSPVRSCTELGFCNPAQRGSVGC